MTKYRGKVKILNISLCKIIKRMNEQKYKMMKNMFLH